MNKSELQLAGWLSVIAGAIAIPYSIVSFMSGFNSGDTFRILGLVFDILYTAGFVYIFLTFKKLLNIRFKFHDADTFIVLTVVLNILALLLAFIMSFNTQLEPSLVIMSIIFLIVYGIISIVFSIKLLNLKNDLYGLLKPLSYITIATGISLATIILFPLAILLGMITDIIIAIVFFKASAEKSL